MPLKREDTERALQVMEACQAGAAEGVKGHAEKLLNIFQSDLFQALLDREIEEESKQTTDDKGRVREGGRVTERERERE
ncbi:Disks large -like protein 4 [Takifugu flavidus]|uniref:Disks large-like protein 4 n=1 Tax=Takifugu flavidus TaxID=433684 RepID=A0A5C6NC63_9TELE|nr:Disks large -like protein 4 [Takifugu flavidus]